MDIRYWTTKADRRNYRVIGERNLDPSAGNKSHPDNRPRVGKASLSHNDEVQTYCSCIVSLAVGCQPDIWMTRYGQVRLVPVGVP